MHNVKQINLFDYLNEVIFLWSYLITLFIVLKLYQNLYYWIFFIGTEIIKTILISFIEFLQRVTFLNEKLSYLATYSFKIIFNQVPYRPT